MKTIKQWFETLPPGYRELALANLKDKADKQHEALSLALCHGFVWSESPENYQFWEDVHDWTINPERYPLPALPKPSEMDLLRQTLDRIRESLAGTGCKNCFTRKDFDRIVKEVRGC